MEGDENKNLAPIRLSGSEIFLNPSKKSPAEAGMLSLVLESGGCCDRQAAWYFIRADGDPMTFAGAQGKIRAGRWRIEVVERSATAVGFEVLPKRWIVERTFAWVSRFRRMARDFERYGRTAAAFIRLAMIRIMLRRLTNPCHST
jgi:hypothetical protein